MAIPRMWLLNLNDLTSHNIIMKMIVTFKHDLDISVLELGKVSCGCMKLKENEWITRMQRYAPFGLHSRLHDFNYIYQSLLLKWFLL